MTRAWAAGAVAGLLGALVACSSSAPSTTSTSATRSTAASPVALGSATAGTLSITGAYIPKPASPDVAAAYLTITAHGAGDVLTGASSPLADSVALHQTIDSGDTGRMVPVTALTVPADGSVSLSVGARHLMLMNPRPLQVGQRVPVRLTFAKAGQVTVQVPVVPLTGPTEPAMTMSPGTTMTPGHSMPGMSMPG